jgi:hypothetical protein
MSKDSTKTVRIRKIDKVAPDDRGRSVWLGKVDTVELELVSTSALEKILKTDATGARSEIRKLAAGRRQGVLARDTATGHFRIVSEADARKAGSAGDELQLVNTQILRKALKPAEKKAEAPKPKAGKKDRFGGFNPYDNN